MKHLDLREYEPSKSTALSVAERDCLAASPLSLRIEPAQGKDGAYHVIPSSTVGAVEIGDLSVLIRPKIGIPKLLSLACYAIGMYRLQDDHFNFEKDAETLPDTLALALAAAARRAFSRGLLHGYITEEEALLTVRGRIRFEEQLRRRFGIPLPVEVIYDEFTDDTVENRLVKAAVNRLGEMRLRSSRARRGLGWLAATLENVSYQDFPPTDIPEVSFNQLNQHYRNVVGLSRLILQYSTFESRRGNVRVTGFLMDMNKVFQEFVTVALREELGLSEHSFGEKNINSLDDAGNVHLRPDLTWRRGGNCLFVGDVKYKVADNSIPNSDLYQLLAYVTALNLPGGMLIYAKGEVEPTTYNVRHSDKELVVTALDLSGSLDDILRRVADVACRMRAMYESALATPATS